MSLMGLALVVVLGLLGARWLYKQQPKRKRKRELKELMLVCEGDQDLVERLIFAEMERDAGIDFTEAARRARRRLRRDRG